LGDKATDEEKASIDAAISELEAATKENDVDAIKAKIEALSAASLPLMQRVYEQNQEQNQPQGGDAGAQDFDPSSFGQNNGAQQQKPSDDGVVDAEFTEVKDDKK
jgi:molecular chaperone DnaK